MKNNENYMKLYEKLYENYMEKTMKLYANINKRRSSVNNESTTICELCKIRIVKSVNELREKVEPITAIPEDLANLNELIKTLSIKTNDFKASIETNTEHIQTIDKAISSFKNSIAGEHTSQPNSNTTPTTSCEDFEFGYNHEGKHVLLPSKSLESNPAKDMEEYHAEFLPTACRNDIAKFLTSKNSCFESSVNSRLLLGEHPNHQRSDKVKKKPIPKALLDCIDLICSQYPDSVRPNSVEITKYTGHLATTNVDNNELYTIPQSHIFTINIGDSCDITFTDKIYGTETNHSVSDNSLCVATQISKDF